MSPILVVLEYLNYSICRSKVVLAHMAHGGVAPTDQATKDLPDQLGLGGCFILRPTLLLAMELV